MNVLKRDPSEGFGSAFRREYGLGRENWAESRRRVRDSLGKGENAPRIVEMVEAHPGIIRLRENLGVSNPQADMIRDNMGMGLEPKGKGRRAGQLLGALAADLTQDTSRGFYWLLNALQASGAVITEAAYGSRNPNLFDVSKVKSKDGYYLQKTKQHLPEAFEQGLIDINGETRRGVRLKSEPGENKPYFVKQNYSPGDVNSLLSPSGIAINSGLGLLTPFGGAEGYEAAVPDSEDKTKTANVLQEVGAKYLLGQTGKMLPYSEFSKIRPDVSPEEYRAYKAFKYKKEADLDITDGDISLPTGVVKYTNEGIHGPELQFLGRGLPVTTGIVPFATAVAGTTAGVGTKRPIRGGLVGGMAGLVGGQVLGNLIEGERRRRNQAENERQQQL